MSPAPSALLDILASYAPDLVLRRIGQTPAEGPGTAADRFPAAVLFADVSGFTALTELLAARRPGGVEFLTRLLNDYFGQIIDRVLAHGGDVVNFAGDAVVALWRDEAEPLETLALRAAQCALQVQAQLEQYVVGGDQPLVLRLGLGAGPVTAFQLGGLDGQWEFCVVGEALEQAGRAERQAPPGGVVASPEAWRLLRAAVSGAETAEGAARLERVLKPPPVKRGPRRVARAAAEAALRGLVPAPVQARLAAGQLEWLAELRTVTALFIFLRRLDHRLPLDQAQAALASVQREVRRYEGALNKLTVDDKGVTVLAAFGLPPLAHEDDAARGVLAALAVRAALAEVGLTAAVGVATGRVFCGVVGNERRREYTMIGDTINVAARLMQAATPPAGSTQTWEHAVLCDTATRDQAQARVEFESLPPLTLKGKAEPVAVHRPRRARQRVAHAAGGLVGRPAERAALAASLRQLRGGETPPAILVEAEPGVGKTRLAEELRLQAEAAGLAPLVGAAEAVERATPYFVWREVFAGLFDLARYETPAEKRAAVLAALGPELAPRAPLLAAALPLEWPETDLTRQMTGSARADSMRDLLAQVLQEAALRAPRVVLLEDGQWMDTASWDLAHSLCQRPVPLLLMVTTRPLAEPPPGYTALRAAPATQYWRLEALPPEAARTLIQQSLGVRQVPEAVGQFIAERAEGNAFFTMQLAYALRDSGALLVRDGVCHVRPGLDLAAVDLPDTVQGVVTGRIDRLGPEQQLTLKVASVIGRVFSYRVLDAVHPIATDRARLPAQLTELERLDLTALESPEPDLSYTFKHSITHDVAYNLMLLTQRQRLHRAVAEWHEHAAAGGLAGQAPVLAHHWRNSDRPERALDYLEQAGDQALQVSASREALGFFEQALELLRAGGRLDSFQTWAAPEQQRRAARLTLQSGLALWGLSDYPAARRRLEGALGLARALDLPAVAARALNHLGRMDIDQGHYAEARRNCAEGRAIAQAAGDQPALISLLFDLAYVALLERSDDVAAGFANESLTLARALGDRFAIAQAANLLGILALYQERPEDGRSHFETYLEMARQLGHRRSIALALMNLGEVDYNLGRFELARERITESLALGRAIGERMVVSINSTLLGRVLCELGELPAAARCLREALEVAQAIDAPPRLLYALLGVAQLWLAQGRAQAAVELVGLALMHPARSAEEVNFALPLLARARTRLAEPEVEEALDRGADLSLASVLPWVLTDLEPYG